ncbi:hypothetical protein Patl1_33807 [Pistacia atlantica]|uniref:Uncharacterized protein n=1 Tax=Pistacia atlantica TaxID=434234 RepID=A0ACC0ZT45_9ROSI|nr:hypothetical protein Patl1_33807 [Pistacia atlantica]
MAKSSNLVCLIILYATALNFIGCYAAAQSSKKLLFVFGDSLFDPGNNQYLNSSMESTGTYFPYGMTMNNKSTGRISDGLLVPDFIALFRNLSVDPPYMQPGADLTNGANFASAGSGVLGESNGMMNLNTQLENFKKVYSNSTKSERVAFMQTVVANLTNGFKEIYALGGRKFAIQNVGPLGCLPSTKANHPELNEKATILQNSMARTSINLLCAIILCAIALSSVGCYAAQSKKLLFVFGDSLFDPGNNQYLNSSAKPASTWYPYGIDMNNKSTGRFSDGLIVPDYIAQFANLSVVPPYLQPGADLTKWG